MKTPSRSLLQSCSLLALCAAPLFAAAQAPTPPTPGAAPAAAAPPALPMAPPAPPAATPLTAEEASYLIGLNFGQSIHGSGMADQFSLDAISRGTKDGFTGAKKFDSADQRNLQAFIRSANEATAKRNQQAGKDFLEKNGKEKGVVTTASGLQYKILVAGDTKAASPGASDQVTVQYRGTLLDGTEFDSTAAHNNQPLTLAANRVIKGWTEALQLMKPGAKWRLWIPADLGYGDRPQPGIPGGSTLTFDVELVSFQPAPPPPAPPARPGVTPGPGGASLTIPTTPPASK